MQQAAVDMRELADKIVGAIPRFDSVSRQVAVRLYRLLAEGNPVSIERLANTLGLPSETVSEVLSRYPAFYDDQGAVIGFGGLTVAEMPPHIFRVEGRTLYTWCALDSLFIPGILGKAAEVTSRDPITHAQIYLTVAPDGVQHIRPESTVVSMLTPDRTFDRDVIVNFCHFVHFFGSQEAGKAWTAQHPGTFLVSVDEAFALGRLMNVRNYGEALITPVESKNGRGTTCC
jgi:alkylmercury lyase